MEERGDAYQPPKREQSYNSIERSIFDHINELRKLSPDLNLRFEILVQGMRDLGVVRFGHLGAIVTRDNWYDAKKWLMSDDVDWPGSFKSICDVLGIDHTYLRKRIINIDCHICGANIFLTFCRCRWKIDENNTRRNRRNS